MTLSTDELQTHQIRRSTTIEICLYLKEDPNSKSTQKIIECSRVPAMGEFIEFEYNLYRVFLVCHQPKSSGYQASVAALKTSWDSCESLIKSQEPAR